MGSPAWLLEVSSGPVEGAQRALSFSSGSSSVWLQHLRLTLSLIRWGGWGPGVSSRGLGDHFAVDPAFSVALSPVPFALLLIWLSNSGGQMDDKEISRLRAVMSYQHTFTVWWFTTVGRPLASHLVPSFFIIVHIHTFAQRRSVAKDHSFSPVGVVSLCTHS